MAQQPFKINIEKPYFGWIPSLKTSNINPLQGEFSFEGSYSGYQEYTYSVSMMTMRPGYEGHIAPGLVFNNATDAGSIVNGLALNAAIPNSGTSLAYILLDSNRYVTMTSLATPAVDQTIYATVGTTAGLHSGHGAFTTAYSDIVNYAASGTQGSYVYVSWTDNTDGDVGQYTGTTGTANYYTSLGGQALSNGIPHPLFVNLDRNIYIGDGQYLHKFNPSAATFSDKVLTLPPYYTVQQMAQYQNFIAIVAWQKNGNAEDPNTKGNTQLFLWDAIATSWNFQYDLQDFFVSNVFWDGSNLYAITFGRNNTVKLKQFTGQGFDILWESALIGTQPGGQMGTNPPCFGAIDLWLNHIVWTTGNNGNINAWGSPDAKNIPPGFHQIGLVNSNNGMLKNLYQNTLFMGNKVGATYTIKYSDLTKYDTQSRFYSQFFPLPTNSTIDNVKLYFSQCGAGAVLNVGLAKDWANLTIGGATDLLNWNPVIPAIGTTATYGYISQSIANVNGFYIGIAWNHISNTNTAAIIRGIEVNGFSDDQNI